MINIEDFSVIYVFIFALFIVLFVFQISAFIIGMLDGTQDCLGEYYRILTRWGYVLFGYFIGYKIGKYLGKPIKEKENENEIQN